MVPVAAVVAGVGDICTGGKVNERERFHAVMHYEPADRIPYWEVGFWDETLYRWGSEGLRISTMDPRQIMRELGLDNAFAMANIAIAIFPLAKPEVLDQSGDRELFRDEYGRTAWRLKGKTSMYEFVSYPVTDRDSWEAVRERYVRVFDERSPYWMCNDLSDRDYPIGLTIGSFFGELRALLGFERMCYLFNDDPVFIHDILGFLTGEMLRRFGALRSRDFEFVKFWEDMAFGGGSFVSPAMWDEFFRPCYAAVVPELEVDVVMVDCDGDVSELIPLWLEVGVNCPYPMEGRYHDLVKLREHFGRDLLMLGGVNKFALMGEREWIDNELFQFARPMIRRGGFIPMVDHAVPPEVSLENYAYYRRLLAVIGDEVGWDYG